MDQSGLVLLAVAALWIAYLVPHRLQTRQELLESRVEDRFSAGLRVLRVAHAAGAGAARPAGHRPSGQEHLLIHTGGRGGGGGGLVNRPHAARDRAGADAVRASAAQHAHRAAHLARRRAAARRRALLTLVLLVTVAVTWSLVGAVSLPVLVAVTPTVALAGVLVLGRRAVIAAARSDAEWVAGAADRVPLPGARTAGRVTGRAAHPSDAVTEVIAGGRPSRSPRPAPQRGPSVRPSARTAAKGPGRAPRPAVTEHARTAPATTAESSTHRADAESTAHRADTEPTGTEPTTVDAEELSWAPVPVPRPTYTLKPSARRREPAPLPTEGLATGRGAATAPTDHETPDSVQDEVSSTTVPSTPAAPRTPSAEQFDLDAVLARRRAAGE